MQEIFVWYFEQKGVDNPERFLGEVVGGNEGEEGNILGNGVDPLQSAAMQAGISDGVKRGLNSGDIVENNEQIPQENVENQNLSPKEESKDPENSTKQINIDKKASDVGSGQSASLDLDALIKFLEVIEKIKQNDKKRANQSDIYDLINTIVNAEEG